MAWTREVIQSRAGLDEAAATERFSLALPSVVPVNVLGLDEREVIYAATVLTETVSLRPLPVQCFACRLAASARQTKKADSAAVSEKLD